MIFSLQRIAWLSLLLGGGVTWGVTTGLLNPVTPPDLAALPVQLGTFRTLEVHEVDLEQLGELPPDRFTFQQIGDEAGHTGELYIAYFLRGRRWSGRPHEVPACYRALGWELQTHRSLVTRSGAHFEVQDFSLEERRIRVFYWVQQPGLQPGVSSARAYLRRLFGPSILRQDMASSYLEFPLDQTPSDESASRAVEAVMAALEGLWSPR